jgi:hypothetical protein
MDKALNFGRSRRDCYGHSPSQDQTLDESGLDADEIGILAISRHYFQTFALPESQGWLHAMVIAADRFAQHGGPEVAYATLAAVQAMRHARTTVFHYSNPLCLHCRNVITGDECQFMATLRTIRQTQRAQSLTHAIILCEGGGTSAFLGACAALAALMPPRQVATRVN